MGSVPLPSVAFVLRHQADAGALESLGVLICDFLGPSPNLSLRDACEAESIPLLEWLWRLSCTSAAARSSRWTLCNFLRSDLHYRDYQLHHALKIASRRGNVTMIKWLMDHFPCPQVAVEVVEAAAAGGHLNVLELLLALDDKESRSVKSDQQVDSERDARGRVCWGGRSVKTALSKKQYKTVQWLYERGLYTQEDQELVTRVERALRLEDADLVDFLLHGGQGEEDPTISLTPERVDAILQFAADPDCAVHAFPAVMKLQSASLMEKMVQLHSPLPKDHKAWLDLWKNALNESCRRGDLSTFKWQMGHWLGREACSVLLRYPDFVDLMSAAARRGHVEVMEYLHHIGLKELPGNMIYPVIHSHQPDAVKWLLSHGWSADRNQPSGILNAAAMNSDLELLKYFHGLDTLPLHYYDAGGVKHATIPMSAVWPLSDAMMYVAWNGNLDTIKWLHANGLEGSPQSSATTLTNAAENGHLEVVKWVYTNLPERFSANASAALEIAADNGHVEVVKWLGTQLPGACSSRVIDRAAGSGHLEIVKWLHENTRARCSVKAMNIAAYNGHMDVLVWLHENTCAGCTKDAMNGAAAKGHLNVVKWLHEHRREGCSAKAVEEAAEEVDLKMLSWLHEHFPGLTPDHVYLPTYHAKCFDMLLFLSVHYNKVYTRDFIDSNTQALKKSNFGKGPIMGSDTHIASWLQELAIKLHLQQ